MLTIQRQFSLPNCVLILEGFNTDGTSSARPLLSTLTRFECHFGNESKTIQGGRDLLNLLAERVHGQAQSLLSGVQMKPVPEMDQSLSLRPVESGNYQLTIASSLLQETASASPDAPANLDLKLNSVQLFDLVEALDQLMEDQQTLPDLVLKLRPLSRKEAQSPEAVMQKFIPVSLGVASLALVAAISFVMPIPQITKPAAPDAETESERIIDPPSSSEGSDAPDADPTLESEAQKSDTPETSDTPEILDSSDTNDASSTESSN